MEANRAPRRSRTVGIGLSAALTLGALALGTSERPAAALSDWYLDLVAGTGGVAADPVAPLARVDDDEAYFVCAREIVKRLEDRRSIVTFGGSAGAQSERVDGGLFRIHSYVDEAPEEGAPVRHTFVCTVRQAADRWQLESVELDSANGLAPPASASVGSGVIA